MKVDVKQLKNLQRSVSKAELDILINNNRLITGVHYKISDRGHQGLIVYTTDKNKIDSNTIFLFCEVDYNTYSIWNNTNTYNINDIVIWGGKYWVNQNGNTSTSINDLTLDTNEWGLVTFDNPIYTIKAYKCVYDYINDTYKSLTDENNNTLNSNFEYFRFGDNTVKNNYISNYLINNINSNTPYSDNYIIGGNGTYQLETLSGIGDRLVHVDSTGKFHADKPLLNYATFSATFSANDTKIFTHNFNNEIYNINIYNSLTNNEVYGSYLRNLNDVQITLSGSFSQIETVIILS